MLYENTPTIKTARLILRKWVETDVQALFELLCDTEVNTFLPWFPLKCIEEARAFLAERFFAYYDKPSMYRYAICLREDNRPIGYLWLSDHESHDFGYALKKAFWHKGIVTEAAQAVVLRLKHAGYTSITATHDIHNPHSGGVMQKLGMQYQYSFVERVQPKNVVVTFRMYQLHFDENDGQPYMGYWNRLEPHFIEENVHQGQ